LGDCFVRRYRPNQIWDLAGRSRKAAGKSLAVDDDDRYKKEVRAADIPSVTYEDNSVVGIEVFSETKNLVFDKIKFFQDPPLDVLRQLEALKNAARMNAGRMNHPILRLVAP
jgi:hypothetical protein